MAPPVPMKPRRAPIDAALTEAVTFMEQTLSALLPEPSGPESRLHEAMRYATLEGGKRLRAFLVLQSGRLFGVDRRALGRVAAAIECVHAYSLVHDDLPAMDDDDLRRGRLTTHKKFDEATAILAGDALLTFSFALLTANETHADPYVRCELVGRLAQSAGVHGMVGGQMIDIVSEGQDVDINTVTRLQRLKTGALIAFACESGAIMGKASPQMRQALHGFAQDLGLAFQIVDDLLDVEGAKEELGKQTQKDAGRGKATLVRAMGPERARAQAVFLSGQAVQHLEIFDEKADLLRGIAEFVIARKS